MAAGPAEGASPVPTETPEVARTRKLRVPEELGEHAILGLGRLRSRPEAVLRALVHTDLDPELLQAACHVRVMDVALVWAVDVLRLGVSEEEALRVRDPALGRDVALEPVEKVANHRQALRPARLFRSALLAAGIDGPCIRSARAT